MARAFKTGAATIAVAVSVTYLASAVHVSVDWDAVRNARKEDLMWMALQSDDTTIRARLDIAGQTTRVPLPWSTIRMFDVCREKDLVHSPKAGHAVCPKRADWFEKNYKVV